MHDCLSKGDSIGKCVFVSVRLGVLQVVCHLRVTSWSHILISQKDVIDLSVKCSFSRQSQNVAAADIHTEVRVAFNLR